MKTFFLTLFLFIFFNEVNATNVGKVTGFPIPRFVSLKSDLSNLRIGSSKDFPIKLQYTTSNLPLELVQEYIDFECHIASPLRLHPVAQLPFIASYEIDDLWHVYDRGQLGGTAGMADGHPQKRPLTFFTVHDKTQVVDTTYEGERSPSTQMCIPNFRN